MQAVVFGLATPLLALAARRLYHREEMTGRELLLRYVVYTFFMTVFSTVVMVGLCGDGVSFLYKTDASPVFALKYLFLQLIAAGLIVFLDWNREEKRYVFTVDTGSFCGHPVVRVCRKLLPFVFYVFALALLALNLPLVNDNVLWGDEAFSADLVRNSLDSMMYTIATAENHPPLYYLWLKLWAQVFGESGPAYHMASMTFFVAGVLLTATLVRKHFGKIPSAFFLVISGLAAPCLEYNVEIRMYGLAFLSVAFCYYCAVRILQDNRPLSWAGMVLWGLVAAYSHYYALVAVSILMLAACLFAVVRFGRRTWGRVLAAGGVFILGYLPWLHVLFTTVGKVNDSWWMDARIPVSEAVEMIFGGNTMKRFSLPLWLGTLLIVFLAESSVLKKKRAEGQSVVEICAPGWLMWSGEMFGLAVGVITLAGTVGTGLLISELMHPMLARRYVHPLAGLAAMMLVVGSAELLKVLKRWSVRRWCGWLPGAGKCVLAVLLVLMSLAGMKDYKSFQAENEYQAAKTAEVLYLIGEPTEDMVLVSNGVKHLGWTVLKYYYPEAEIINGGWQETDADDFWYFTTDPISEADLSEMFAKGYAVSGYPYLQLVKYPLTLYHLSK